MAGGSGQCVPVAITGSGGQDVRAVDEVPDKLVLIFQEPAENWLIHLQLSPRCIKKMSSRFVLAEIVTSMFYLVLIRSSLAPWMPWSWAPLTSQPPCAPFPCPFPLVWGTHSVSRQEASLLLITYSVKSFVETQEY